LTLLIVEVNIHVHYHFEDSIGIPYTSKPNEVNNSSYYITWWLRVV